MRLYQPIQLPMALIDITKIASGAIAILLFAVTSTQANEVPICEKNPGGGFAIPHESPKDCTGVTGGYGFRNGNLVDCKGRVVCKLPEGTRIPAQVGKPVNICTKKVSPQKLGRACIVHRKDGKKTYLVNKCSCDLNIKWTDRICSRAANEKYPCDLSIRSRGRELRRHNIIDRGMSRENWPDYGTIESVACKSPEFPYEDSSGRVVCQ